MEGSAVKPPVSWSQIVSRSTQKDEAKKQGVKEAEKPKKKIVVVDANSIIKGVFVKKCNVEKRLKMCSC